MLVFGWSLDFLLNEETYQAYELLLPTTGRPGGCLVVLDYCAGQKELSGTFQEHCHRWRGLPTEGAAELGLGLGLFLFNAIQCYSL